MAARLRNPLFWIAILVGSVLSCSIDSGPSLNPGVLDPAFDPGGGANGLVQAVGFQADKKILIGGSFTNFGASERGRVARLHASGSLDTAFLTGSGANSPVYAVAALGGGKVLIGGTFTQYAGQNAYCLARLNADGSLDTTFNSGEDGPDATVNAIKVQTDGKILIGGAFAHYNGTAIANIARLNADGGLDSSFNASGTGTLGTVHCLAVQGDGKILLGGNFTEFNGTLRARVARLNANGSLDTDFDPGAGPNSLVLSLASQSDGKVVIGGAFTSFAGTASNYIARLNAGGSLDASFDPGTGADDGVYSVAVQGNGKILIAGGFQAFDGTPAGRLARLNADGTLDATFETGAGFNADAYCLGVQSDGMILIGGSFTQYDGTAVNRVVRIAP